MCRGLSGICSIPLQYMEASGMKYTLTITGLKGGHSGICIANGLARNAQLYDGSDSAQFIRPDRIFHQRTGGRIER